MPDGIRLGGAYYELTADDSALIRTLARSQSQARSFSDAISRHFGSASSAVDQANRRMAQSSQQAERGFSDLARSAAAFGLAAVGVAAGAALVHQSMQKVTEVTQRANQAQFALNATYKASSATLTEFSAAQAAATKRTTAEVQEAVVAFGSLSNRYAITTEQVKELTKRSADLAAVKGITTVEAAKRLEAALRGEAESAEFLGLTLNSDYLKKFADMSAEQRKNFETLDPLIKAQITYREALKQTDQFLGQAVKRSQEAAGAADRLKTAQDNLALTIGKGVNPAIQQVTGVIAGWIEKIDEAIKKNQELGRSMPGAFHGGTDLPLTGLAPRPGAIDPESSPEAQAQARRAAANQAAAQDDVRKQRELAAALERERIKRELDAADKANDETAESAIRAIDKERKEKERWYDEERQRIEARRTYQLEDIEARRDAAIKALEEEKQAAKDAIDDQIEEQERLKDARLELVRQAADAARDAIDAEKQRLAGVREIEDRNRDDERRAEDRATEDARRVEDRVSEQAQAREIKRLEDLRDERIDAIEDEIEAFQKASQQRLRALDREGDKARATSDAALRRLERRGEKEDEQHRKRMQALDDEQDAQLGILDAQLRALDAQEKSADAAERTANLQKRLADAQQAATAARGTGTPEEVAAARGDLTAALRGGDEISIANARERLVQLAGRGNEAIRKADEDLAEAQAELAKEGVDQARDAERDKIKAAQDAVRARIEARKREEEEEDRRRKQALERDQENERDRLKARLDRLEGQKQAARDADAEELRLLRNGLDEERRTSQETIQQARDRFGAEREILQDRRREEDQFRADQRLAQDRFREDERRAQDLDLARQLAAINTALETERRETEVHFNGPNGTITQLKKASEDTEREYSRRLAAARVAFEEERKAAERVYTNPEGNGLLQLLEAARRSEFEKLEASKTEWQEWQKSVSESVKKALEDLDAFIQRGANVPRIGGDVEAQRSPGSGKLTSTSTTQSRSRTSGQNVQGDVISWLNDAMDITRVPDDWLPGLKGLLDRESFGGDPHAKNPNSTASGLFQLIDSTWAAYRDKKLPNNVFDPVANAVAGINYIKAAYGHPNEAIRAWESRKPHWYDAGGMIREPVVGLGMRSGQSYAFAERGPEYLLGRRATAALGPAPQSNYAGMGAFLSSVHPGGMGGGPSIVEGDINVSGIGLSEVAAEIERRQHRQRLLRGIRGTGRR